MHVFESIHIILMLLSYVIKKTGRLSLSEKHKILSFLGEIIKQTDFKPLLDCRKSFSTCKIQAVHRRPNITHNSSNLSCIDKLSIEHSQ